ncbi:MAG: 6-hydroxymethylpterin diphosphokinase MptE-like protein [Thermodesulfobacteriota bacterium]
MECLARHRPALHSLVLAHPHAEVGTFIPTPSGVPTLLYNHGAKEGLLAYNTGNPWQDAAGHLDIVVEGARGLVVFIGLGLGYGPLLVFRQRPLLDKVVIVEPSIGLFRMALQAVDMTELFLSVKVEFFVGPFNMDDFKDAVSRIASIEDTGILRHVPSLEWQPELYQPLNNDLYMLLNKINAEGGTVRMCGPVFFENRMKNLSLLRHAGSLDDLRGLFAGKPAVLVAAGPSLDRSIPDLKRVVGRCLLIAADSALAPLLSAGIVPDMVTTIDFLDLNFEKVAPYVGKEWPFTLVSMIKVTPLMAKRLSARHQVLAFPADPTHQWVLDALGVKTCAAGALSVAHLSLGMALVMDADPIFFVGQDLSYTSPGADHAANTVIMRSGLPREMEIFYAKAIDGGEVATDRQLMSLQKQFEDIIAEHPRRYFNASAAGVHIAGTEVIPLGRAAEIWFPEEVDVRGAVDHAIVPGHSFDVQAFIKEGRRLLERIGTAAQKLQRSHADFLAIVKQINGLMGKRPQAKGLDDLPASLRKTLVAYDSCNVKLDADQIFEHVMELTYEGLSDNEHSRSDNSGRVETHGYLSWLVSELERVDMVNAVRLRALDTYAGQLGPLVRHLEEETRILESGAVDAREQRLALARLYLESGDFVEARRALGDADADSAAACIMAGAAYAGLLDMGAAREAWDRALVLAPEAAAEVADIRFENVDCWVAYADRYGNEEETGDNFLHLLPVWLGRVAALLEGQDDIPASLRVLWEKHRGKLERLSSSDFLEKFSTICSAWRPLARFFPEILSYAAQSALAGGDTSEALGVLDEAMAKEPHNPHLMSMKARVLLHAGRPDESVALLGEAVALDPQAAMLWEEIGDMLFAAGDHAGAVLAYERCFLSIPGRVDSLFRMGNAYRAGGDMGGAAAAYEAVLSREPAHAGARQGLLEVCGVR